MPVSKRTLRRTYRSLTDTAPSEFTYPERLSGETPYPAPDHSDGRGDPRGRLSFTGIRGARPDRRWGPATSESGLQTEEDFCDWKQSRQYTGRPSMGRNGTVVSQPQAAQVAGKNSRRPRVGSEAEKYRPARPRLPPPPPPPPPPPEKERLPLPPAPPPPPPPPSLFRRLARQAGQRFGSLVRPRSA